MWTLVNAEEQATLIQEKGNYVLTIDIYININALILFYLLIYINIYFILFNLFILKKHLSMLRLIKFDKNNFYVFHFC